jgi:rare lipoprotein A
MKTAVLFALFLIFTPSRPEPPVWDFGVASWYGRAWTVGHGRRGIMANGQRFNPHKHTAASFAYPLGTVLLVTNQANGKIAAVIVTDRGPAPELHRLLDLSESAAVALDYRNEGVTTVAVRVLVLPAGH